MAMVEFMLRASFGAQAHDDYRRKALPFADSLGAVHFPYYEERVFWSHIGTRTCYKLESFFWLLLPSLLVYKGRFVILTRAHGM
jgi:hypothetical protein